MTPQAHPHGQPHSSHPANTPSREQAEYKREGIQYSQIKFPDNSAQIELIDGKRPPGVMALLDEECIAPSGSDAKCVTRAILRNSLRNPL